MKGMYAVVLAAVLLVISGCGKEEKVITGDVANMVTENVETGTKEEVKEEDAEKEIEEKEEIAERGYYLIYKDAVISIDSEMTDVLRVLGEADSYFEAASCAFEGLDKIYTFGSIEIETYPSGDEDYISAVIFLDDMVQTPEGIGIGSTFEEMESVYGKEYENDHGKLTYEKDGMKLSFIMENDMVASVEYTSKVLEP